MGQYGSRNRREYITSRLRLRDFDYSQPGYYFVTICTQNRAELFGEVRDRKMELNHPGLMVDHTWGELPPGFRGVEIDGWVTMPNHVHALVGIGVRVNDPDERSSLSQVLQRFKSLTTQRYIQGVKEQGWPRFDGRLWQPRFHDHIVRGERELGVLREYILTNPERWEDDTFYA